MSDRESRIRDEAHRIWIEAGRPEGDEERHWIEAERRIRANEAVGESAVAKPARSAKPAAVAAPASRAALKGEPVDVKPARATPARRPKG